MLNNLIHFREEKTVYCKNHTKTSLYCASKTQNLLKKTVLRVATVFQRINGFLCNMVAEIHGKVAKLI
jgi:hypothetical protein